jgi:hypothetical protein
MLNAKINATCQLCNGKNFYIMPLDIKTKSNDMVSSNTKFLVECKECRQKYLLEFTMRVK